MNFVSYAQNFEDVMLWRALKDVGIGFYIDVGANDPTDDSVTKSFYDRGWRGVNCEPLLSHFNDLVRERPRDMNIQCALGETEGEIDIWECDIRGWATTDMSVVESWRASGIHAVQHKVPLMTLNQVCETISDQPVHFLKVDVEGAEEFVLRGIDFTKHRPWVVVVEATVPNSTKPNHMKWEHLFTAYDYSFAYTDGLNRFYVAKEHASLLDRFNSPPNVFDQFITAGQHFAMLKTERAEASEAIAKKACSDAQRKLLAETEHLNGHIQALNLHSKAQLEQIGGLKSEISNLKGSSSWRATAPLRWLVRQTHLVLEQGLAHRLRLFINKLSHKISGRKMQKSYQPVDSGFAGTEMPSNAKRILDRLLETVEQHKKDIV